MHLGTSGYGDVYTYNRCIIDTSALYSLGTCDINHWNDLIPYFANNHYFTKNGTIQFKCGSTTWDLKEAQAHGVELGTEVSSQPTDDEVIQWGKELLGI